MNTTSDKLNLLLQTKADLKAALIEKGQEITDETPFSEYANLIRAISGKPAMKPNTVFGVMWNYKNASTALTRLTPNNDPYGLVTVAIDSEPIPAVGGGEGSSPFDEYMPWGGMEEYNIINGNVSYMRGEEGFSRIAYDTMVYIPEFWIYVVDEASASKRYWYISGEEKAGFVKHPGSGKYIGRYTTSTSHKSTSGNASIVSLTRATARANAKSKGTGWQLFDFASWCAATILYLVEYADWNSQAKVGRGYVDGNPAQINTGTTDIMTYHTGRAAGVDGKTAIQYRHIENLWGNIFQWIDGINFNNRKAYICTNPNNYADDTATNYIDTGITLPSSQWITGLGISENNSWVLIPSAASGGSENTYIPDYVYSSTGWCVLDVGGCWGDASRAGAFYFHGSHASSSASAGRGARLLFSPTGAVGVATPTHTTSAEEIEIVL